MSIIYTVDCTAWKVILVDNSLVSFVLLAENPAGCFGPPPESSQNAPLLNLLVPQKNLLLIPPCHRQGWEPLDGGPVPPEPRLYPVCLSSRLQQGYNGVERAEFQRRE
jgi:hypothetical protein